MRYVYLAGGKSRPDWRERLWTRWGERTDIVLIDPFVHSKQGAIYEFTRDDLSWIDMSSLVFALVDFERYTGTALEFGYAFAKGIPIVFVTSLPRVDSMMAAVASAVFTDLNAAVEFAERRYL